MKYLIFVLVIIGAVVYLNRAYNHIYAVIGKYNLPNPTTQAVMAINSPGASSGTATYMALGDSLTAGVGVGSPSTTFPYLLASKLAHQKGVSVSLVNLGQPGATALDVLNNQLPLIQNFHPDIITLLIGINDMHNRVSLETFKANLSAIKQQIDVAESKVYVLSIPYLGSNEVFLRPYQFWFDLETKRYNAALREVFAGGSVSMIDLYSDTHERALSSRTYYSADGLHPSALGYSYWADMFYDHFNR